MSKNVSVIGLALALAGGLIVTGHAAAPEKKTLKDHVPSALAHLQAKGRLAATTNLHLAIGLPVRDSAGLSNLIQQVSDPASPLYRQYLTPEQFTAQFGPTEQDYQAVLSFAQANGLTVQATHANRMLVDVSGRAGDIEKAFNVTLKTYRHPTEARDFFAADTEPSVPATLPIQDISGLENYRRPHSHYKFKSAGVASNAVFNAVAPNIGSGPSGNYMGDDFRHAYVPSTTLNGAGQAIALVQFDGYLTSDILQYEALTGRTNIPLQNVLLDGFNGLPTGGGGEVEVSLDIEMVVSMAPALTKIIVYEGSPFNFHPNDVLSQIASDNAAKQVSCSWGWTGGPNATTDQIFQQMAVQGQTFFDASGDSDAYPPGTVDSPSGFGTPADSPYVTSVGGTTLTMNVAGVDWSAETVWNWGGGVGSSGGTSSYYAIPSWQAGISMTLNHGSTTKRNFPDVAMTGDNVFVIADGGIYYTGTGGTSCAAPLWAGFTALVNQLAASNGKAPVGFINPALYTIASGPSYTSCFHDITTGNNVWSGSPTNFFAVTGYDLCAGLGTPAGTNLIIALAGSINPVTHVSPPLPPYGSTLAALNGGNPNGTWNLFVIDDSHFDSGVISNGWVLTLTTATPVGYAADVAISMTVVSSNAAIGGNMVYLVGVTNYGPSTASNVIVSDSLPLNGTYVSATVSQGSVNRAGSNLGWSVGTLATNAGALMTLTLQASSAGSGVNSVFVNADTPDPNPDDDFADAVVTVASVSTPPQLSAAGGGGSGTFQLSVTSPAASVIIQASTNLLNWVPVYTNLPPFTFSETNANYRYRFYRAVLGQ